MIVTPLARAVTSPVVLTLATLVSPLAQVTSASSTMSPSGPITVAESRAVSPAAPRVSDEGSTRTRLVHSGGLSVSAIDSSHSESEGGRHSSVPLTMKLASSRSANEAGTRPVKRVATTLRVRRLSSVPSFEGSSPLNPLTLRASSLSRVRFPTSGGMEPETQFRPRSRVTSWSSWPIDECSDPRKLFPGSDKLTTRALSSVSTPAHSESGSSVSQLVASVQPSPRALS